MPSGLVQHQYGMRSRRHRGRDLGQVQVHRHDVATRHDQGCTLAVLRTNGAEDIGRGGPLIAERHRSRAALAPAPADLGLLSDARFVLKPHFYRLAGSLVMRNLFHTREEVFLKASSAGGSWA